MSIRLDFVKGAIKSNTQFVELASSDEFERELGRRAIRILNDGSLDRERRVVLIRRLQQQLLDYRGSRTGWLQKPASKWTGRRGAPRTDAKPVVVGDDPMVARRRELCLHRQEAKAAAIVPIEVSVTADVDSRASKGGRFILTLTKP